MVERPPRYPGEVGSPSRMSGSGRESLTDVRERSETLPDVQDWSGIPSGCPGVVGRPSRMTGSGRDALPDVRV